MFDYLLILALLLLPVLISKMKTSRKGLVIGLFVSLFFWGRLNPLLSFIPAGAAIVIFLSDRPKRIPKEDRIHIKRPSLPMFVVFLTSMTIFTAFGDSFINYGQYLNLSRDTLFASEQWDNLACLLGPLLLGNWCDRKGPFGAAIFLTLLSEVSVWMAGNAETSNTLFIVGSFSVHLCISGFFVLMPVITSVFFGENHFLHTYPAIALFTAAIWTGTRLLYLHNWQTNYNPGSLLISLLLLTIVSAIFIFIAWRRRFVLVKNDPLLEKQG